MDFQLDAFFKSPYLFEVGVYFRHMHLWRDPHVRESPGSLTPSVFLRHPVKPYKNNQNFQSVESSFTVFFLRKKPRRKKSSHQDPGISPTHQSVQKQWSEITLRLALSLGLKRVKKKQSQDQYMNFLLVRTQVTQVIFSQAIKKYYP